MARASRKRRARPASVESRNGAAPAGSATPAPAAPAPESGQWFVPTGEELTRTQRRDAEARAALTPLAPGERPGIIVASAAVAAIVGLANLVAFAAGVKIGGKHPATGGIVVFSAVMLACAIGLWRLWYGAVLGFMALLAIVATIFALLLIEASNVLGLVVALAVIIGAGYLFFKLVRVLSRIQMPRRPGS
ncbi:MAG: hypothetical protein ABSH51_12070 [Solirubrobacteraceae bacterium]